MKCLSLVAMLMIPALASGQAHTTPLTLEEAITQGLANSRRLAEIEARGEAADFAIAGRQAAERPLVALQAGYSRTNHVPEFSIAFPFRPPQVVYPDIPDNYRSRIDLQWPIYTGGRADTLERAARAERTAIGKDLEAARADLRLEITRVLGRRDRARCRSGAAAIARGRDRAYQRRPRQAGLGTGSAERRVVRRGAGLPPAAPLARGHDPARDCRSRPPPADETTEATATTSVDGRPPAPSARRRPRRT